MSNPVGYHLYADDGFEAAYRSLSSAKSAALRGSSRRKNARYFVVQPEYGRTGGGRGILVGEAIRGQWIPAKA